MPTKLAAVALGVSISSVQFAVFIALTAVALRKKMTTAAAIMEIGVMARLAIVGVALVLLINNQYWLGRIYWIAGGLIISQTVFMALEICFIIMTDKLLKTGEYREESLKIGQS